MDGEKLVQYILDYRAKNGGAHPPQWEIMAEFQWSDRMLEDRYDMAQVIAKARKVQL